MPFLELLYTNQFTAINPPSVWFRYISHFQIYTTLIKDSLIINIGSCVIPQQINTKIVKRHFIKISLINQITFAIFFIVIEGLQMYSKKIIYSIIETFIHKKKVLHQIASYACIYRLSNIITHNIVMFILFWPTYSNIYFWKE